MHIEHGLYSTIVDIVEAMKDKVRKRTGAQKYQHNGFYVSVDNDAKKLPFIGLRVNQCL